MKKLICVAAFTAAAALAQVAGVQRMVVCTDAGASDAYACTPTPAVTAFAQLNPSGGVPVKIRLVVATANTGAATLDIDGGGALAAKSIVKYVGGAAQALADNDLRVGQAYELDYDATGDQYRVLSLLGNGGSGGGGAGKYYQSWFTFRDYAGNKTGNFGTTNVGGDAFYLTPSGNTALGNSIVGYNVSTTANEKVGVNFRLPFTPTAWTIYVHINSRSTSQVTFSVARQCVGEGEAIAAADNAVTGSVTPSATDRLHTVAVSMVLTGCAANEIARVVVSTTTTVNTDIVGISTEVTP